MAAKTEKGDDMTILEIFEKVNLAIPIEQRDFFNYFDDSVREIEALYASDRKNLVFKPDTEYTAPATLGDENAVLPLYSGAIVDNILFMAGQGEAYKNGFLRKARSAYLNYWNKNAKGKRMGGSNV